MINTVKARLVTPFPLEFFVWVAALAYLFILDPGGNLVSICPLKWVGFSQCPGCGLGRSVAFLMEGNLTKSLEAHSLGTVALAVLLHRIFTLSKSLFHSSH